MKELPYWWEHAPPSVAETPALPARADVAVIGSGYTGLSAALTLARAGRSVIVFESDTPGIGASSRNGGMLGSALKPSLGTLTRRYGAGPARALLAEAREAYDFLGRFIAEENIDCDYAETGGFTGIVKPAQYDALARETEHLSRSIGLEANMVSKSEVRSEIGTDVYCGGRVTHRRAGLHPARYHAGLIGRVREAGAMVVGNCAVTAIQPQRRRLHRDHAARIAESAQCGGGDQRLYWVGDARTAPPRHSRDQLHDRHRAALAEPDGDADAERSHADRQQPAALLLPPLA